MRNKGNIDSTISITDEIRDQNSKFNLNKFEYDLYHEEDDTIEKVIRVKRFVVSGKNEKWKIFENSKIILIVEGNKINNKEKEFLRSIDGVNFLINQCKNGIKSFNSLKNELKKVLK